MKAIIGMSVFDSRIIFWAIALTIFGLTSQAFAQRRPLSPPKLSIKTGQVGKIGRIDFDPKTGNYIFTWKGFDGKTKRAVYVPPWKATLTVIAKVKFQPTDNFVYTYTLINSPKSQQSIIGFWLAMSESPKYVRVPKGWKFFGINLTVFGKFADFSGVEKPIKPGQSIAFELASSYPPGVVTCYADTDAPIMRVPEEMPGELEERLVPGSEKRLGGKTVGPYRDLTSTKLLSDWQVAIQEGWVKEKKFAHRVQSILRQIILWERQKRTKEIKGAVSKLMNLAQENLKHMEPEAQALLLISLPYPAK